MPFASSAGCRIYYRLEGVPGRPLLVLVHSLGTDHGMWDAQVPALSRSFQLLRVDLRGHGASDAPHFEYSIELLAHDVLAVIKAIGANSFFYCGLSLGGMIGQWLAAHTPASLERLILANTSPKMPDPAIFDSRRATALEHGMGAIEDAVMQRFFSARTLAQKNPFAESIRATFLALNAQGYADCCSAIRDMDQRALLSKIKIPTLVIGGDQDQSTPWQGHGDVLAGQIEGATSVVLHTAHLSNVEQPSSFSAALLDFLLPKSDPDTLSAGFAVRRSVLGDAYVDASLANATDLNREFQEYITRSVWGAIWTRPGLDPHLRRLLVLAITASLGRWEEFRLHVKTGLANELEISDLKEVLLQIAPYAGVPAANTAFHIAGEEILNA